MSCCNFNNGNKKVWIEAKCDVCFILRKDANKKKVYYCNLCKSNICSSCENKYTSRLIAAVVNKFKLF